MSNSKEKFSPRQVEIIRRNMPKEKVTNRDIELILEKCKRFDLPDLAHEVLKHYQVDYEPYTPYERSLLKGTVKADSKEAVWTLIKKVEIEEGEFVAAQLFDRFEHYLTGIYPDMHDWLSIKESLDLIDETAEYKTNWHYDELYPDGNEENLYGRPRRHYYKYFIPPCKLDYNNPFPPNDDDDEKET